MKESQIELAVEASANYFESMYLDYFNNYLTVQKFAADNNIGLADADRVLRIGKIINHKRGAV